MNTIQQQLQHLAEDGNLRTLPAIGHHGRYVEVDGRRLLNLGSNDYLGLASDEALHAAFLHTEEAMRLPFSSSSSRLLTGNFPIYTELEAELARLYGREAALVLNSGYHANTGILPAVTDGQTLILADKLVHASLIDGIRLSAPARCIRYRHNDYGQLERLLHQYAGTYRQLIIVTESIFSMDGDRADLHELVRLKKAYPGTRLYVDEAHAFGVRGACGLGCAEEEGVTDEIDWLVGTFGKAAASVGAFVVCSRTMREWLVNRMRTLIFSTALPPVNVAWTLFVLRRLPEMGERRAHLKRLSATLRKRLLTRGYRCPGSTHIVPVIIGSNADTLACAERLNLKGFYCPAVRPPTVPEGTSRLRFSLMASMTEAEIEALENVF